MPHVTAFSSIASVSLPTFSFLFQQLYLDVIDMQYTAFIPNQFNRILT
jgi:hypothetical protein